MPIYRASSHKEQLLLLKRLPILLDSLPIMTNPKEGKQLKESLTLTNVYLSEVD